MGAFLSPLLSISHILQLKSDMVAFFDQRPEQAQDGQMLMNQVYRIFLNSANVGYEMWGGGVLGVICPFRVRGGKLLKLEPNFGYFPTGFMNPDASNLI